MLLIFIRKALGFLGKRYSEGPQDDDCHRSQSALPLRKFLIRPDLIEVDGSSQSERGGSIARDKAGIPFATPRTTSILSFQSRRISSSCSFQVCSMSSWVHVMLGLCRRHQENMFLLNALICTFFPLCTLLHLKVLRTKFSKWI